MNTQARPLLHAICCITSDYLPVDHLSLRSYWPTGTPLGAKQHPEYDYEIQTTSASAFTGNSASVGTALHLSGKTAIPSTNPLNRFRIWHRRQAIEMAVTYSDRGEKYIQLIQTLVLVTGSDQLNSNWVDLWQLSASCLRLAVPLRMYSSGSMAENAPMPNSNMTCPPRVDPMTQAEKDRTWWMAWIVERTSTMWTTWPLSLADDEITTELPVLQSTYDAGYGDLVGVQSIQDPNLYSEHPGCHLDSLALFIKATKLFADAQRFFRFHQRQPHTIERYMREPVLHVLLSQANAFRLSLPVGMRKPTEKLAAGGKLDRDMLVTVLMLHGTLIVLGEPMILRDSWQDRLPKLALGAIRVMLSLLYDSEFSVFQSSNDPAVSRADRVVVTATTYDVTLLPASISYLFLLAGKAMLRFVDAANQSGDVLSSYVFRGEIDVFQCASTFYLFCDGTLTVFRSHALRRHGTRFALGYQHAKMLGDLLAQHDRVNSTPDSYTSAPVVEDMLEPMLFPGAVGIMRRSQSVSVSVGPSPNDTGFSQSANGTGAGSSGVSPSNPVTTGATPTFSAPSPAVPMTGFTPMATDLSGDFDFDALFASTINGQGSKGGFEAEMFDITSFSFDLQQ